MNNLNILMDSKVLLKVFVNYSTIDEFDVVLLKNVGRMEVPQGADAEQVLSMLWEVFHMDIYHESISKKAFLVDAIREFENLNGWSEQSLKQFADILTRGSYTHVMGTAALYIAQRIASGSMASIDEYKALNEKSRRFITPHDQETIDEVLRSEL